MFFMSVQEFCSVGVLLRFFLDLVVIVMKISLREWDEFLDEERICGNFYVGEQGDFFLIEIKFEEEEEVDVLVMVMNWDK